MPLGCMANGKWVVYSYIFEDKDGVQKITDA